MYEVGWMVIDFHEGSTCQFLFEKSINQLQKNIENMFADNLYLLVKIKIKIICYLNLFH